MELQCLTIHRVLEVLNERYDLAAAYLVAVISSKCMLLSLHAKSSSQLFYLFACITQLARDLSCLLRFQTSSVKLMPVS